MRRIVLAIGMAAVLAVGSAGSALAVPPEGSCAPPFIEADLDGLLAIYPQLEVAYGRDAMAYVVASIDLNGNGEVCAAGHPEQSASSVDKSLLINLVDDTVAPHP